MVETPQLPPDPESSDDKLLGNLRHQVAWAAKGDDALRNEETPSWLIAEATSPESGKPNPTLLGMLLQRESLIQQIAAREHDPTAAQDQLKELSKEIYDAKISSGIQVVDQSNPPLDNDN